MSAERRVGKPYIHVSWLSKLLGGDCQCVWAAWFKAHHQHDRYEPTATSLAKWSVDHDALVQKRRDELAHDGWAVTLERANEFRLEGNTAVVAGRMDLVAARDGMTRVEDAKTGKPRQGDWWQVLLYLYALPKTAQFKKRLAAVIPEGAVRAMALGDTLSGHVIYREHAPAVVYPADLTDDRRQRVVQLIRQVGGGDQPPRAPSVSECARCNIGPADCPERVMDSRASTVDVDDF